MLQYSQQDNKKNMNKLEHKLAESLDMTRCARSGAGLHKGDVRSDIFMLDLKFTYNANSISIKKKDFQKLDNEAFLEDKIPVLVININGFGERYILGEEEFKIYKKWREENYDY